MFGSILQRAIFWELFKVFFIALLAITGILLLGSVVTEASQQGLSPSQVAAIIPLLIPSTLPFTIPATTLFAACVVYGRLSHGNEILAIKAAGVHLMKVVWPAFFLGLFMSGVTMAMYVDFIPYTHHLLRTLFINDAEDLLYAALKRDLRIRSPNMSYCIFVERLDGRQLIHPIFKRSDAKGNYDLYASAREAQLRVNPETKMLSIDMRHGAFYTPPTGNSKDGGSATGTFSEEKTFEVPLPPDWIKTWQPRPRDRTVMEILEHRRSLVDLEKSDANEMALATSQQLITVPPQHLHHHVKNLNERRRTYRQEISALDTELHMRPSLALGCLCFVLVGCPVGIWFGKSDYLSAFVTCFLPIIIVYYPLMLCGTNLARSGRFPPAIIVWLADVTMLAISGYLFRRLLRN